MGFSDLSWRYRRKKKISCILALTILTVDTLTNIWSKNIPNFITLKTFGWKLLIGLAWWQRFDPTRKKCRNLMSKRLIRYLQNCSLGLHFATILYNPWQAMSSISLVTPSGEKNNSKKTLTHTLCFGKGMCGRIAYLSQELSLASKKNLADSEACDSPSLCFHFTSKSENHINLLKHYTIHAL